MSHLMSHLMLLTETLESATEMLQTSRFRSSSGRSWKDFLDYYDFADIFNIAQCDCSHTAPD